MTESDAHESALIITVPAAEPAVARYRASLDDAAADGVPAHITVLYPFAPPAALTDQVRSRLAEVLGQHPAFSFELARVAWFGTQVVWLAPEPAAPFAALTAAVHAAFPEFPPYGGAYDDATPHLTVGHDRDLSLLQDAERDIAPRLPISARVDSVRLMHGIPGRRWVTHTEFPLLG